MCHMSKVQKKEECFCCQDIDRCREKLDGVQPLPGCITEHPGFRDVCLSKWTLEASAIGLKTRNGRRYTVLREKNQTTDSK